jgi:hypothetical protein
MLTMVAVHGNSGVDHLGHSRMPSTICATVASCVPRPVPQCFSTYALPTPSFVLFQARRRNLEEVLIDVATRSHLQNCILPEVLLGP